MHEPVGRSRFTLLGDEFAAVKAIAVNPETQSGLILDAEIIAGESFAAGLPPFHGDAFRALHPHHHMGCAPTRKMVRRTVGDRCKRHLDGFELFKQPQWPQWRLALLPCRPDR